jgi:hypothetical protein
MDSWLVGSLCVYPFVPWQAVLFPSWLTPTVFPLAIQHNGRSDELSTGRQLFVKVAYDLGSMRQKASV